MPVRAGRTTPLAEKIPLVWQEVSGHTQSTMEGHVRVTAAVDHHSLPPQRTAPEGPDHGSAASNRCAAEGNPAVRQRRKCVAAILCRRSPAPA
ncbi:hypothetical protein MICRO116_120025 [Micrococcus sp. 116]|nr:hypothetical protein MICRO116_120025 [Micrococcus sp. 116]